MQNFNDLFVPEYHKGLFIKFHEFYGHIHYSFIPAYENLVHLKVYTLKEFLLDLEYGLLDLGSNLHFLL